jgi:hypothetical protein
MLRTESTVWKTVTIELATDRKTPSGVTRPEAGADRGLKARGAELRSGEEGGREK